LKWKKNKKIWKLFYLKYKNMAIESQELNKDENKSQSELNELLKKL
jgi:hypothetical protein